MTCEVKGKKLVIEIDLNKPTPSASGKSLIVASTNGFAATNLMIDGKSVKIAVNAIVKP